jgi:outer membrane lipoprotein-sorting protein
MKLRATHIFFFSLILISAGFFLSFKLRESTIQSNNLQFINRIFDAIDNVKTLKYSLQCNERIRGRMQHSESKVKLQINPRKLYLNIRGVEVLWAQGENNGEALVNPNAFPYINLNLDTYGSLMRKDQHHTIHEMGYHYLADILKDGMKRAGENNIDKYFKVLGEEKYNGRDCYKLSISFPDFEWVNYTVKKGENLTTLSRKLRVSEYMVLENNPKLTSFNDVKEGQVIRVPNAYAKLTLLLIDKEYLLPVNNKVFDDKGLYETYEYYDLQVNPAIAPEEFKKNYKDYHFF